MRIGVHPNNLHLLLARHWPGAFAGLSPDFVAYPEGRSTGRLLAEGRIDVGGTGSTPPILAQVSGLDVIYLAASAPRPANGAILVRPDSPVRAVADLAGRTIALLDGSFHTYLLARVLATAGLTLPRVTRVELSPAASREALASGRVDAWVAMAPHLGEALASGAARELAPCGDTIPNRSVFWTIGARGLSAAQRDAFVAGLIGMGRAIADDIDRAARILAGLGTGGVDAAAWRRSLAARDWTVVPADAAIVAEQEAEKQTLIRHGDIADRRAAAPAVAS